jgi:hypothetical protein
MHSSLQSQDSVVDCRGLVPYVTSWSSEEYLLDIVVERRGIGIAYLDVGGSWPDCPEGVAAVEPPTCPTCVVRALQACPLREGAIVFRAKEFPRVGVCGGLYECDSRGCRSW